MPKVNPWSLKRPDNTFETRTITDEAHPGVEFTLSLRPLSGAELMMATEASEANIVLWVRGDPEKGTPPNRYPCEGEPPIITEGLVRMATMIEQMQKTVQGEPYDPDSFYSFGDLVGLSHVTRGAWLSLALWAQDRLNATSEALQGNEVGAAGTP